MTAPLRRAQPSLLDLTRLHAHTDEARGAAGIDRIVLALERLPATHPAAGGRGATEPTAWVCRGRSCSLPVRTVDALLALL